ncbi:MULTISPECIES: hypothetical protein [Streptococcus anginosus group]|uniref:Phage protein n=1 Tax=Streptococcus constellatus TaxID=76860 RepID=A0A0C1HUU2_STRCV|nr:MULTISPECIES: hypothetical protein [Streptococcus anginosus group]QBX22435.1 hypothetical protein Javan73_0046 [Streptococcus phage Javan73]QBX23024.1 hypothetical protein Javan110_0009 [Streptococcus phage Javan110]ALL02240.1 hypothetical protein SanJ4211_0153 [Streptococcus anginosus]KIC77868.1 phage protein [Streptococcus constellatus]UGQ07469.1 hypothetical protein LPZ00_000512 [Streptococcus anginosus]
MSLDELKEISMGMALDYQTDYINARTENSEGNSGPTRKASQSDFNSF